jgi:3-dehydroquinate synthase
MSDIVDTSSDATVLCDCFFASRFEGYQRGVIDIEASEAAKSLDRIPEIVIRMRKLGTLRQSRLIAIGGGVIQDVATFCSSVYMRGISWQYLPTTLLGMVDSCIGGKSAINVGPYKNIVGNYYPPDRILIDPGLVSTLGIEQKVAGFCEAAKICYAHGEDTFRRYLALDPFPDMREAALARLIELSLLTKQWFVEVDEFDHKERLLLNFGHTFGHAIEGATHFSVSHGVAVGVGILAALKLARELYVENRLPDYTCALETYIQHLLSFIPALDDVLAMVSVDDYFERFTADKKHTVNSYTVVGIAPDGGLQIIRLSRDEVGENTVRRIFDAVRKPGFLRGNPAISAG